LSTQRPVLGTETAEAASGEKQELGQRLGDFAHEIVSYGSFTCVWEYTDPPATGSAPSKSDAR